MGLASCKKDNIRPENKTVLLDIFPNDWTTNDKGVTYFRDINIPALTSDFNNRGQVIVSMSFENVNIYEALPQVFQGLSYRFTTEKDYVRIIISSPNGGTISKPTFESTAKVTLIDAVNIN